MSEYKPIPVAEAKRIAETYGKDQVLIFAWDKESNLMHSTTYGVSPADKQMAADGAETVTKILCDKSKGIVFEDFRKPKNCTCRYPEVILRNMNGHDPSCPVYIEWHKEYYER